MDAAAAAAVGLLGEIATQVTAEEMLKRKRIWVKTPADVDRPAKEQCIEVLFVAAEDVEKEQQVLMAISHLEDQMSDKR